jgi:hypothetical protein
MPEQPADRQARLAAIRQQIAAGTYETPDKLELAVERLLRATMDDDEPTEAVDGSERPRQPR